MAYAVMSAVEQSRTNTMGVAHLPSLTLPEYLYFRSFGTDITTITLTTEARRKFLLSRINMTDILPPSVYAHYEVAESLARDNHPTIRVLKECGLHKEMLFSTPVINRTNQEIIGVLLAYDEVPDNLCPSPGHLLQTNERKTGFLTSLFSKQNTTQLKRGWTLNQNSPNPSEKSFEYTIATV